MQKQSFDAGWEFFDQPQTFFNRGAGGQSVHLPHDASIGKPRSQQAATRGAGGYAWSGVVTYRKHFNAPADWQGSALQLEFEGVYMNAEVTLNGQLAALHPYGYTSFLVDLAPYLRYGADNELTVTANNSAQPNSRWYTGTGIYRHVWLWRGAGAHIPPWGVFVTTPVLDPAAALVAVTTELVNDGGMAGAVLLRSTVRDAAGQPVAQVENAQEIEPHGAASASQELKIANPALWSLEQPNLYTLISEVLSGGELIDIEETPFGIRTIAVDAREGFRLNGVPMKLKGGCVHHDNGLLGAASYDRAEERKIELMKAAGYNAIRCAHNPPAPAMLDACDRLGMLVIDETFDCWRMGKNPNDYHLYFEDWWQRDTESMVRRDRNHPSIFMWSIGNEVPERTGISEGVAWARKQAGCIRALDGTRPVTSAVPFLFEEGSADPDMNLDNMFDLSNAAPRDPQKDRWGSLTREFNAVLDVVGYNYLCNRYAYDGERFPGRVIAGTETWPHQAYVTWDATLRLPYVIGDFVWTALDYLGESGIGKVSVDDTTPFFMQDPWPYHVANCGDIDICGFKRPQSYYRDLLWGVRTQPFIAVIDPALVGKKLTFNPWGWEPVIDSWSFPGQEGRPTRVEVYCADEQVELWINGVSAGRKPAGAASLNKAVFEVTYQPGTLAAVGYRGGQPAGETRLVTAGAPAALRLTPDRAAIPAAAGSLAYVTLEIVDANGQVVRYAEDEVTFALEGPGDLLALGSANPLSEELYVGNCRKAYQGRLMAVVRAAGEAGEIRLSAKAEGLNGAEVSVVVR